MIAGKTYKKCGENIVVNTPCFDIGLTLDCGQAFRWSEKENGEWHGVAYSKPLTLRQSGNGVEFIGTSEEDFEKITIIDPRYFNGSTRELVKKEGVTDILVLYNIETFLEEASVYKLTL